MLASCGDDKSVRIWQRGGEKYAPFLAVELTRTLFSVSWSKTNGLIATCGSDNAITILNVNTDTSTIEVLKTIDAPHGAFDVNSVSWCPLENFSHLLASGGDDGCIKIHSVTRRALI
jgi:WD40 repeat protein